MADIAILVAEEQEERTKNPKQDQKQLQDLRYGGFISATVKKMMEFANKNAELKVVFEPKSQFGRAAFAGFFSA